LTPNLHGTGYRKRSVDGIKAPSPCAFSSRWAHFAFDTARCVGIFPFNIVGFAHRTIGRLRHRCKPSCVALETKNRTTKTGFTLWASVATCGGWVGPLLARWAGKWNAVRMLWTGTQFLPTQRYLDFGTATSAHNCVSGGPAAICSPWSFV
jgi:hypothetical protein